MSIALRIPRFLCPALARGIRSQKRTSGRTKEPLVQNIAKLEAYINELRKDVRKRSSKAKVANQERDVEETDIDQLYQSLEAPARQVLPSPKSLLPPSLCAKLSIDARASGDQVDWSSVVIGLIEDKGIKGLRTSDVNHLLAAMPHNARIAAGRHLYDSLMESTKKDRLTYDLLMDSYATTGQAPRALEMFDTSRAAGITPSLYSYAHLMKAFTVTKDLPKAMTLYRHMQDKGIEPNLVIHTSLIAACIKSGKVDWAFTSFEALKYKSKASAPDAQLYSLMIHACSLDTNLSAERASDLFTEMTERGLKPTKETFNALLNVYSQRKDYYTEAWKLSDLMQRNAVEMDKVTWHSLLSACVTNCDISRARHLVKEMMKLSSTSDNKQWTPEAITYQLLFRAYAHAKVRRSHTPSNILETTTIKQSVQESTESKLWVDEEPFSSDALLCESAQMMSHLQYSQPHLLSTQLIDTYMTIAPAFEALERFKHDFATLYAHHEKGRYSYQVALEACYAFKDWNLLQCVWAERQAWRASLNTPSSVPSKNQRDVKDEYGDFQAVRTYIECLSRQNRIQQATDVLQEVRHKYPFEKRHLKCFQTKSIQVGDEEAVTLYLEMFPLEHQPGRIHKRRWY